MNDKCCKDFQAAVDNYLIRHRSALDVMTKYQESTARVSRAFAKAVTECGCVSLKAEKQKVPEDATYSDLKQYMSSHICGELCEQCKEILAEEMGHNLFYLAALCNMSGLEIHKVMRQEYKNVSTLGVFRLL